MAPRILQAVGDRGREISRTVRIKKATDRVADLLPIIAEIRASGATARQAREGPERARYPHGARVRVAAGSGQTRAGVRRLGHS
jgi:hypothetical protein